MFKRTGLLSLIASVAIIGQLQATGFECIPESMWKNSDEQAILSSIEKRQKDGYVIDPNHRYLDSKTAVHHAAIRGFDKVLNALLDAGCPVDLLDRQAYTPLMYAVAEGKALAIKTLIEHGANLHVKTRRGSTLSDLADIKCCSTIKTVIDAAIAQALSVNELVELLTLHNEGKLVAQILEISLQEILGSFAFNTQADSSQENSD